jgi:acetyl esterase/lipase
MKLLYFLVPLIGLIGLIAVMGAFPLATINALVLKSGYELRSGIPYGALERQKLDVYQPTRDAPEKGYPMVVFFYGGSWNRGERADYKFIAAALASRGVLTVVADYRLFPEVRYPDFLSDSAMALAFGLKKAREFRGNPNKVFVMGHSAGAYNAAMLALDSRWLKATGHGTAELAGFIGLAGPYNFLPMTNPDTQPVFFHPNYPAGSQPIDYVTQTAPRSFIAAAKIDDLVNPERNSLKLAERLSAAGKPATVKLYERVNHMTIAAAFAAPLRWLAPVLDDVIQFIESD